MKRIVTITFVLFVYIALFGQAYDAEWVIGPNTSVLDFRIDSVGLDTISSFMNTKDANADICDTAGNLLYYSNGFYIAGRNGAAILNGDTLSPCLYTDQEYSQGLTIPQAIIFLPKPGDYRYYYAFHFSLDTINRPNTIYYTLIDKEGNSGFGSVISKNVPILKLQAQLLRGGGMTACKHANGRDYWIVMPGSNNNVFYKFLLTPDTILGPFTQFIGPVFPAPDDIAYSKFSQDGSKYVTSCYQGLTLVMNFDRCSGEFSNPLTLFHYIGTFSGQALSGASSEEFSPSGRFLYVNGNLDLTQYDLWTDSAQDSVQIYVADSNEFYGLNMFQIAPNGKIYGSTWNGGLYALHVINRPDLLGDSCKFVYGGQPTLSNNSFNLPNMINYNLGPLVGSGCDTITSISKTPTENNFLRILPNPADKYAYVEVGMQGNYEFDLLNTTGRVMDKKETRQVDIFNTEKLSAGVYVIRVIDKTTNTEITTKKLVIVH